MTAPLRSRLGWTAGAAVAVGLIITLGTTYAMNLNLAMSWDDLIVTGTVPGHSSCSSSPGPPLQTARMSRSVGWLGLTLGRPT